MTPQKQVHSDILKRLVATSGVTHLSWKDFSTGSLAGRRVLYAWPNQKHLNGLWGVDADALAVIEWNEDETAEWIEDANPVQLFHGRTVEPQPVEEPADRQESLPNGVDGILEHIAAMATGYSSGLKWNEEDMLKADMMNRPDRWASITVEQVRTKYRALGMRPDALTPSRGSCSDGRMAGASTCRARTARSISTDLSRPATRQRPRLQSCFQSQ